MKYYFGIIMEISFDQILWQNYTILTTVLLQNVFYTWPIKMKKKAVLSSEAGVVWDMKQNT